MAKLGICKSCRGKVSDEARTSLHCEQSEPYDEHLEGKYICQNCRHVSRRWMGKCPNCSEWNTFVETNPLERPRQSERERERTKIEWQERLRERKRAEYEARKRIVQKVVGRSFLSRDQNEPR